jgi:hypothetical protein
MGRILLAEAETCSASAAWNLFAQYKLPVAKTYPILNTFLPPPLPPWNWAGTHIYRVPHCMYLCRNWGSLPPLSPTSVPLPPEPKGGGGHTRLRVRGWGSPNSDDGRKSLALCLLCAQDICHSFPFLWHFHHKLSLRSIFQVKEEMDAKIIFAIKLVTNRWVQFAWSWPAMYAVFWSLYWRPDEKTVVMIPISDIFTLFWALSVKQIFIRKSLQEIVLSCESKRQKRSKAKRRYLFRKSCQKVWQFRSRDIWPTCSERLQWGSSNLDSSTMAPTVH